MDALRRLLAGSLLPVVLTVTAGVLLFAQLDEPPRIIFDEVYYVGDANDYLDLGVEDSFAVHPPVGKWLIATGIFLFGDNSFGWRFVGALAGATIVLLTYLMGVRLFRMRGPAAFAALLVMTDGLWFVQSRTSMLDIYLALFVTLGAWLLLVDRDRGGLLADHPRLPARAGPRPVPAGGAIDTDDDTDVPFGPPGSVTDPRPVPEPPTRAQLASWLPHRGRGARWLAGVAFGLAIATKWSGLLALAGAGLICVGWELALRKRVTGAFTVASWRWLGNLAVTLVVVPTLVYGATYVPWLINYADTTEGAKDCPTDATDADDSATTAPADAEDGCDLPLSVRLEGLVRYHDAILDFHLGLDAEHPYRAPAYTWPVMARPVVYYYENCTEERANGVATTNEDGETETPEPCVVDRTEAAEIIALGNPALWYSFLIAAVILVGGLARRDSRAWFLFAFWAAQFLPWLIVSRPVFFFYMTPVVPFLALSVAYAAVFAGERRRLRGLTIGALVGAAAGAGAGLAYVGVAPEPVNRVAIWITLGVGLLLGSYVGSLFDHRRDAVRTPAVRFAGFGRGVWIALAVSLAAVALFVYFYPVWSGVPLADDLIRQRWWIRPGWI